MGMGEPDLEETREGDPEPSEKGELGKTLDRSKAHWSGTLDLNL